MKAVRKKASRSAAGRRTHELRGRYEIVMGAINESVYEWDLVRDSFWTSESMQRLLGLSPGRLTLAAWRKSIHPDDYARFRDGTVAHLKGKTERFECDYRFRAADGSWHWARTHGLAVRDRRGRALRMIGSTGDITALKRAESRYTLATSAAVEGIYEWDLATGSLFLTERAKAFFGIAGEELTPAAWNTRIHAGDFPGYREALVAHFKGRTAQFECEYRIADGQGGYKWLLDRANSERDAAGRVVKLVGALSDITQRKRHEIEVSEARDEAQAALAEQTATAEILRVMANSPADPQPVLDAIARNAVHLCDGTQCAVFRYDGRLMHFVAHYGVSPDTAAEMSARYPRPPDPARGSSAAILERATIHVPDIRTEARFPGTTDRFRRSGYRGFLAVPMLKDGRPIGVIFVARLEPRPFSAKQVALLRTFADEAAIAVDNVRLFNETKEALEQQAAAAEILRVMSGSPGDVQPVFEAIVRSGVRLFAGAGVTVACPEKGEVRLMAIAERDPERARKWKERFPFPLTRQYMHGVAILDCRMVDMPDVEKMQESFAAGKRNFAASGYRAMTVVPMVKDGAAIGTIAVVRDAPGPLSEKQIALLKTFADQAVIAIENSRLFNEIRESLEQQKAAGEVLRAISGSMADTAPVFDAIVQSGLRMFGGMGISILLLRGDKMEFIAGGGAMNAEAARQQFPMPVDRRSVNGIAILERRVFDLADTLGPDAPPRAHYNRAGFRAITVAPLLREGVPVGTLSVMRGTPGLLGDKQVALLQVFADQAVIAIENARLFNETREALEQQKALAEVVGAISSSVSDTKPVFDKIVESCQRLFEGHLVGLTLVENGNKIGLAAYEGPNADSLRAIYPLPLSPLSGSGAAILERTVKQYPDIDEPGVPPGVVLGCTMAGVKAILFAPLIAEGRGIGALWVGRESKGEFGERQIALLRTFADQAVIAMENARLFNETKEALEQQTATAEILKVTSASPADVKPVFEAMLAHASKLCEASVAAVFLYDGEALTNVAQRNASPEFARFMGGVRSLPSLDTTCRRCALERRTIHTPDLLSDPEFAPPEAHRRENIRTVLSVPMLREGSLVGVITLWRREVRPFTAKQISLVETFAQQAVLAIESVRLFNEIQEKSRQLEIASRHKSEFLANMSHELRTPLNAIIGFTRIVMRRSKGELEPQQYENLEKILMSGQHLLALINSILDLSKIEAGRVEVRAVEVGLAPVLEQCVRTVEPLVDAGAVALVKEFNGELPRMVVDEEKLRQIVINLLSNAVKFTERGTVRLQAAASNGSVAIAVADTGIGIPADKLDLIFGEFEQVDASSTRAHGGSGLGLAIARRLARLMGGEISAESTLGTGSRFTLTLPLRYGP